MAFIRNTDKFVEGLSNKFFTDGRAQLALQPTVTSLESEDSGMKLRLDVIEGGAGVEGSIAKAQADAQSYADQKVAALVNSAPEVLDTLKELSDAIGGDASFASTIAGQIGAVDAKVDQEVLDRQAAISVLESAMGADVSELESADAALSLRLDELELDPVTKSYVDSQDSGLQSSINSESSARQSADSALSGRLDVIEGVGEGSVAKAEQDAKDYADGLDSAMDARMLVLEADPVTKTYVDGEVFDLQGQITQEISDRQFAVSAEESRAMTAEGLLSNRLDILELDPVTKTYVDGEVSDLQGQISQEILDRQADVDAEEQRALAAEVLLSGRLDTLELDPVTKTYVDGEVSDLQGQITQEINDRQSAVSSEQSARQSADSALSGRLDTLETDPVTKSYVDSEVFDLQEQITQEISDRQSAVSSEQSARQSADSALSGRLDVLESDPVTKTYVDGEVSDLQGQIDTEKGRVDAILSASEADKDSFAEIVQLINSVDTSNDQAFAGYVLSNDAALAQEVSDRQAGDGALSGRLDIIEGLDSVEGSVAKAEKDAKEYADAAVLVEKTRAESAEGLLDGRLDVLEADPTTKSYVDGIQSSLDGRLDVLESDPTTKSYVDSSVSSEASSRQSADNALDSRLDVLESDPTTKTYVDSQVSAEASARSAEDLTMVKLDGSRAMTGQLTVNSSVVANAYLFQNQGTGNIILGREKPASLTTSTDSISIGSGASNSLTTGSRNITIGGLAGQSITTANNNIAIGQAALQSATTAGNIVAIGLQAGQSVTNANANVYIGDSAGRYNTAGANTFVGAGAATGVSGSSTGGFNTALGRSALGALTSGSNNVAIGARAGDAISTGNSNVSMGLDALGVLTTGSNNIAIGNTAGDAITTGSNNVIIGDIAGDAAMANTVIVASGSTERFRVNSSGNMGIGTTNPSEKLEVAGGMKFSGAFIVKSMHSQTGTNDVISVSSSDFYVGVNCLSAEKTVQLPAPVAGKKIIIKDESGNAESNNITVEYPSGNIDGLAEFKLTADYESACFISDGTNWFVI